MLPPGEASAPEPSAPEPEPPSDSTAAGAAEAAPDEDGALDQALDEALRESLQQSWPDPRQGPPDPAREGARTVGAASPGGEPAPWRAMFGAAIELEAAQLRDSKYEDPKHGSTVSNDADGAAPGVHGEVWWRPLPRFGLRVGAAYRSGEDERRAHDTSMPDEQPIVDFTLDVVLVSFLAEVRLVDETSWSLDLQGGLLWVDSGVDIAYPSGSDDANSLQLVAPGGGARLSYRPLDLLELRLGALAGGWDEDGRMAGFYAEGELSARLWLGRHFALAVGGRYLRFALEDESRDQGEIRLRGEGLAAFVGVELRL